MGSVRVMNDPSVADLVRAENERLTEEWGFDPSATAARLRREAAEYERKCGREPSCEPTRSSCEPTRSSCGSMIYEGYEVDRPGVRSGDEEDGKVWMHVGGRWHGHKVLMPAEEAAEMSPYDLDRMGIEIDEQWGLG